MKVVVSSSYPHLGAFAASLPTVFATRGVTLLEKRNVVKLFDVDGLRVVVKKFKKPNIVQRIAYTWFKPSKARRAYLFAGLLRHAGVLTPHEIACVECRRHGMLRDSYFAALCCDDLSVSDRLLSHATTAEQRTALCAAVGRFIADLHTKAILHGDLNISNILCRYDGAWLFTLIDTDRARFRRLSTADCLDDLKRVSHDRDILLAIADHYAAARGWSLEGCRSALLDKLDAFERKNAVKLRLKSWLRPSRYC